MTSSRATDAAGVTLVVLLVGCGGVGTAPPPPADAGTPRCVPGPSVELRFPDPEPVIRVGAGNEDERPATTSIRRVALGGDDPGIGEQLLVTEAQGQRRVAWIRGPCDPTCRETRIPGSYREPVRTAFVDWDGDGDQDVLIADIGELPPSDALVGRVLLVERIGPETFSRTTRVLTEGFGRISCAEPGDFDGDGDQDVAVCEFGNLDGSSFWLVQEDGDIVDRVAIDSGTPGTIHLFPFDADDDGDLDLAAAISQLDEAIVLYRNEDGRGRFVRENLLQSELEYFGTSGIELADMDFDGDVDILHSNGDILDFDLPVDADPSTLHGIGWLENDGRGRFTERRVADLWGAYAVRAEDLDGDCLIDVVAAAYRPDFFDPPEGAAYVYRQRPDGGFEETPLGDGLELVLAVELADLDGDGRREVWTGSLGVLDATPVARLASQRILTEPALD